MLKRVQVYAIQFAAEHPQDEFVKQAENEVHLERQKSGNVGFGYDNLRSYYRKLVRYPEIKGEYMWGKIRQAARDTIKITREDLAIELQWQLSHQVNPAIQAMLWEMAAFREKHDFPTGYGEDIIQSMNRIVSMYEGEIESFCDNLNEEIQQKSKLVNTGNYIFIGGNAERVYVDSKDHSVNYVNQKELFTELRKVAEAKITAESDREKIVQIISEMESCKDKASFFAKQAELVACGANWMTILSPFLPALTGFGQTLI